MDSQRLGRPLRYASRPVAAIEPERLGGDPLCHRSLEVEGGFDARRSRLIALEGLEIGMDLNLRDRAVLVAGGSRGIGLGIAEVLLAEGAKVAIVARGAEELEAVRGRLAGEFGHDHVWAMAGDMRETTTIERAVEGAQAALGPLWGAVANVGLYPCPPGFEMDDETWDQGFAQNLDSGYRLARSVLRGMTERGEAHCCSSAPPPGLKP